MLCLWVFGPPRLAPYPKQCAHVSHHSISQNTHLKLIIISYQIISSSTCYFLTSRKLVQSYPSKVLRTRRSGMQLLFNGTDHEILYFSSRLSKWYTKSQYRRQSLGSLSVGVSAGAINLKTHRKCVWAFIKSISNLVDILVSNCNMRTAWIVAISEKHAIPEQHAPQHKC